MSDKLELGDASHAIEVHRITGGPHNDSFLMVYLPKERLLIEGRRSSNAGAVLCLEISLELPHSELQPAVPADFIRQD